MGSIEDSRKAVQDFLAPDLKALTVRLESLEKEMHAGFAHAEKMNLERLGSVKTEMAAGFAHAKEQLGSVKTEMAAGFAHAEERLGLVKTEMHAGFAHAEERLGSVKTEMHAGFAHAEERLGSVKTEMAAGFAHAERMNLERFASASARHDALLVTMAANHASIMNTLEFEKRLTRLESERKAEPPHA